MEEVNPSGLVPGAMRGLMGSRAGLDLFYDEIGFFLWAPPSSSGGLRIASAAPIMGDIDLNGVVNFMDLIMLLVQWSHTDSVADINGDGTVNVTDLLILLANWGVGVSG